MIIKLIDQNDNAPVLVTPKSSRDIVQIKLGQELGQTIVQLKFEDKDQGKNGKILATLERQNSLFHLSDSKIILSRNVERKDLGLHPTRIRLQDLGDPSLFTTTRVSQYKLR